MANTLRQLVLGAAVALGLAGSVLAQTTAPASPDAATATGGAPAGFVAPAEPKGDESNAQRAQSQPGNNAPLWRAVRNSGTEPGVTSLPGAEKGVLVQPFVQYPGSTLTTAGEAWRQVRNDWIIPYGAALLVLVVLAIAIYYLSKGPIGHAGNSGTPAIERFTAFERSAHWANAISFVILGISGIVMAFGKFFLLPVMGGTLFGWLTYALKTLHNFVGPVFAVSLLVVILAMLKDNLPKAADITWLTGAGGMFSGKEYPSHRFNGGEKLLFWVAMCFFGLVVVGSGLVLNLLIPGVTFTRGDMQIGHMIHSVAGLIMLAMLIGHIYMGTIGTRGALVAMKTGWVDEDWAREHHRLWYDDIKAGKLAARRSQEPPPPIGTASARV